MGCLCYGRRLEERLQKGFLKTPGSWEGQGLGLGLWWRDWGCLQPGDFMALEQSRGAAELWWMCSFVDGCPAKLCLSILYLSTQDKFFHIHSNVDWISLLSQVMWHAEDISTTGSSGPTLLFARCCLVPCPDSVYGPVWEKKPHIFSKTKAFWPWKWGCCAGRA